MTGLGLVSCLDASYAGYSIVTRASLKENKNSFAVLPLYSEKFMRRPNCARSPPGQGSLDIKEMI